MSHVGFRYRPVISALVLLGCVALPATAQEAPRPQQHTVRRGDTLWDLSSNYLGNPFLWPMIYEANRSVVEDPHWIYPAEVLMIPPITPVRAQAPIGDEEPEGVVVAVVETLDEEPADDAAPAVLELVDMRRSAISPAEYRATPWVSPSADALVRARLVALGDPSEEEGTLPPVVHPNYRVHVGEFRGAPVQSGDSLLVVRFGDAIAGWGQVVEPLAILRVDRLSGTTASARVVKQFGNARVGDRVIALDPLPPIPAGEPVPVADGARGELLRFMTRQPLYGTGEHAFVSLGQSQVQPGDELMVFVPANQADAAVTTAVIPPTEVARARVVRVEGRSATVRLTRVEDTSVRDGLPVQLVARAP